MEADLVRLIFARYLAGVGISGIADELNRLGFRSRTGGPWNQTTLSHMLKNPVYYGALRWNYAEGGQKRNSPDSWIIREGTHDAIIDKETFLLVQRLQQARTRQHPRALASDFPFSGVLFCADCEAPMYGKTIRTRNQTGKRYTNRYYVCQNRKRKSCPSASIREDRLEALFLPWLTRVASAADLAEAALQTRTLSLPGRLLEGQLEKLQQMVARWEQAYAEGALTLERFRERMEEAGEQEAALRSLLAAQAGRSPRGGELVPLLTDWTRVWPFATIREKKQLITILVKNIQAESRPPAITRIEFH
nr:recombinase family protein [Brevibacillus sp. SYP-B805]